MNDLQAQALKGSLGRFATGVAVVTGLTDGVPSGLTCQSFVSVSLEPPLIAISPSKKSQSWPLIAASGAFCVNVACYAQRGLCRRFATSGGDKFRGVTWRPSSSTESPVIAGCVAWIDCLIEKAIDVGDHYLVIGLVVDHLVQGGSPLLYYRSQFHSLGVADGGEPAAGITSASMPR